MQNIYATCVELHQQGILIIGKSGSGKSDIALRLIEALGATLIADDRTNLSLENNDIIASCPDNIRGLLEIRGLGIIKYPSISNTKISLVVELVNSPEMVERLPEPDFFEFESQKIRKIKLYPFTESAIYKIKVACDEKL